MTFQFQTKCGIEDTFWTNIDRLRRILHCFSKDNLSQAIAASPITCDQIKEMDSNPDIKEFSDCNSSDNRDILLKKIENILQEYLLKKGTKESGTLQMPNRRIWKNTRYFRLEHL
ncbi:meiotic recombination protein SPO11 [Caerostris darwini]|uniref:Meiotic recombination protein SPO11 n=1 Tax=Caerostris darwini TaxID=1538125 RepID=A0AAV4PZ01_9ARAC|nr:meiotic recombination protein SPO11 [Caerostris darwini]